MTANEFQKKLDIRKKEEMQRQKEIVEEAIDKRIAEILEHPLSLGRSPFKVDVNLNDYIQMEVIKELKEEGWYVWFGGRDAENNQYQYTIKQI